MKSLITLSGMDTKLRSHEIPMLITNLYTEILHSVTFNCRGNNGLNISVHQGSTPSLLAHFKEKLCLSLAVINLL